MQSQLESYDFVVTETYVGNNSLSRQVGLYGSQNRTYGSLHPVLHGSNPDYTVSDVA